MPSESESFEDAQPPSPGGRNGSVDLRRSRRERAAYSVETPSDRLPPHALEAEAGVLGCCILSPREALPLAISKLNASAEAFYDPRHQVVFANLMQMASTDIASIDLITLHQRLRDLGLIDECGGLQYLSSMLDTVPSPANVGYYAEIVFAKYLSRKAIQVLTTMTSKIYEDQVDPTATLDEMEREVLGVRRNVTSSESFGMKQLVPGAIERFEKLWEGQGRLTGIATGFLDYDRLTGGLQAGEMTVIAARPSMGKTSLVMNIAEYVAVTLGIPVGVFSLEMTKEALTDRLIAAKARVNLRNLREGFLSEMDVPRFTSAAAAVNSAPIRIDDTPSLSVMSMRARARTMWQQYGIKLFVIDYMQLMHSTTKRAKDNRQLEVTEISGHVKALAKELGVPVIVLSQLNRNLEREKNRRPNLSDLRESGAIEQDADVVGLLYKPSQENEEVTYDDPDGVQINLMIAKQRNGPTGDVPLTFLKPYTRFESAAKVSDNDVPE